MKEEKLLKELGKYLKSKGWDAVIINFKGIAKREGEHNFSLMVDFTGKKLKDNQIKKELEK